MEVKSTWRFLLRYFLQGLLLLAPISITIFVIYKGLIYVDGLLPFNIPGLGLVTVLAGITLIGYLSSTIIAKPLLALLDDIISRAPLIKIIYTSIKEFLEAFMGKKKKFNEPVLVKINEQTGLLKLGFITERNLENLGLGDDYVAVYFPHSYNFSGNLFFVPARNVIPVTGASMDVMKFVVTAGVTSMPEHEAEASAILK